MSSQTTRALLCLGHWSPLKFIRTEDLQKVSNLPDLKEGEEAELEAGWDSIGGIMQ
jgi:hypothetical protein